MNIQCHITIATANDLYFPQLQFRQTEKNMYLPVATKQYQWPEIFRTYKFLLKIEPTNEKLRTRAQQIMSVTT